jgi:ABC-type phosphate/phosphonate transport system ATPase subunit
MDSTNAGTFLFSGNTFRKVWLGGRVERKDELYSLNDETGIVNLDNVQIELNEGEFVMVVGSLSWAGSCFAVHCERVFQTKDQNAELIWRKEVVDMHNSIY